MTTLTEFLLARIAEDEAGATLATGGSVSWRHTLTDADRAAAHRAHERAAPDPARVLAECEAKRRIVELAGRAADELDFSGYVGETVLQLLALPYADHPDYREEWKP